MLDALIGRSARFHPELPSNKENLQGLGIVTHFEPCVDAVGALCIVVLIKSLPRPFAVDERYGTLPEHDKKSGPEVHSTNLQTCLHSETHFPFS